MYAIVDYTYMLLYKCDDCDLRDCLESVFDCEQDGVQEAINALCDAPLSPVSYWAESFLNVALYHRD